MKLGKGGDIDEKRGHKTFIAGTYGRSSYFGCTCGDRLHGDRYLASVDPMAFGCSGSCFVCRICKALLGIPRGNFAVKMRKLQETQTLLRINI